MPVWNEANAKHLLARTLFGYTRKDLEFALSLSLEQFIDNHLLATLTAPAPPNTWVTEDPVPNNGAVNGQRTYEMQNWWINLMLTEGRSMREKMVLFWHNHFVSEINGGIAYPQYMYIQNKLFRDNVFGNMVTFTKAVNTDPAMLIYLNGNQNTKDRPNENYSRELLELFTIGIGNYTEQDIKEGARALTGWRINKLTSTFNANLFDNTNKTYLGQTGNFNNSQIVDIIFSKPQTATYLCSKIYKEFLYYKPEDAFVAQMADLFKANNFEIKPVLAFLLKSDHFYDDKFKGVKIKSPVEFIIGILKNFDMSAYDLNYCNENTRTLQQTLFDPPDVRGWEGQRKWVSTATLAARNSFSDAVVNGKKTNGQNITFKVNAVNYARTYANSENAVKFVEDVCRFMCNYPVSQQRKDFLLETLLSGTIIANWSTFTPGADTRIQGFLRALMRLPEFQLC